MNPFSQTCIKNFKETFTEFLPELPAPVGGSPLHVAVKKSLTCLCANKNCDFNRSDLRTSWQDTPCWNCNRIIQFVPVNTLTAVRSVSCVYLAGITLEYALCGSQLGIVKKRSAAVLQGCCYVRPPSAHGWVFLHPFQTLQSRLCVFVGISQCSQLVSTSWPLAFRNPFLLVKTCPLHTNSFRWQLLPAVELRTNMETVCP